MLLPRAIILWSAIIPLAVANGIFREKVLAKRMGPRLARTASGIILSLLILGFTTATIAWLPVSSRPQYVGVGLLWLCLTVAFELSFGHFVARQSFRDLLRAYRFHEGNIWPVVLAVVTVAPIGAAWIRELCRGAP